MRWFRTPAQLLTRRRLPDGAWRRFQRQEPRVRRSTTLAGRLGLGLARPTSSHGILWPTLFWSENAGTAAAVSAAVRRSPPAATAFDEGNILRNWSDSGKRHDVHKFEVGYDLWDTPWVVGALNSLQRNCRTVPLANLAQLVNVIAPITITVEGILFRANHFPLELYANRSEPIAPEASAISPRFPRVLLVKLVYQTCQTMSERIVFDAMAIDALG